MSKQVMKRCQVCGNEYPACSYCEEYGEGYSWRTVVCCREHFLFHLPIIQYIRHKMPKGEAKEQLTLAEEKYGKIDYLPEIQKVVNEIFSVDKPKKKTTMRETVQKIT